MTVRNTNTASTPSKSSSTLLSNLESSIAAWRDAIQPYPTPEKQHPISSPNKHFDKNDENESTTTCATPPSTPQEEAKEETVTLFEAADSEEDGTNSNISIQHFRERLRSFTTLTYFAKPDTVSPLICARFGWKNVAPDVIQCAHCNAAICISFSPKLSTKTKHDLSLKYQQMLATSHHKKCMWKCDAERWLIFDRGDAGDSILGSLLKQKKKKKEEETEENTTSPVFNLILNVCPNIVLFQKDLHQRASIIRHFTNTVNRLQLELLRCTKGTLLSGNDNLVPCVKTPKTLRDMFETTTTNKEKQDADSATFILQTLNNAIYSQFGMMNEQKDGLSPAITKRAQTQEVAILALLGWSPVTYKDLASTTSKDHCDTFTMKVRCPICQSQATISLSPRHTQETIRKKDEKNDSTTEQFQAKKRKRTAFTDVLHSSTPSNETKSMDPIKSHASFCPYVGGCLSSSALSSVSNRNVIGWKILVEQLLSSREGNPYKSEDCELLTASAMEHAAKRAWNALQQL